MGGQLLCWDVLVVYVLSHEKAGVHRCGTMGGFRGQVRSWGCWAVLWVHCVICLVCVCSCKAFVRMHEGALCRCSRHACSAHMLPAPAACGASGAWCCPSPLPRPWAFSSVTSPQTLLKAWARHAFRRSRQVGAAWLVCILFRLRNALLMWPAVVWLGRGVHFGALRQVGAARGGRLLSGKQAHGLGMLVE